MPLLFCFVLNVLCFLFYVFYFTFGVGVHMTTALLVLCLLLIAVNVVFALKLLARPSADNSTLNVRLETLERASRDVERSVREENTRLRQELQDQNKKQREEVTTNGHQLRTEIMKALEQVHKGLGEMQSMASGVGDLKRILGNVKTRGIWGEVQLGNLLEQVLAPEQFARNVAVVKGSRDNVEFAIKLPGRDADNSVVYLPIDSKFPVEDYQRLLDAQEKGDAVLGDEALKSLDRSVRASAKTIQEKYIHPPATTDFAILYLPTEGLYAEVLRRPGLVEALQRDYRINIAGPTTLAALLNSLQMGFRTVAIEKRSGEVWKILGSVKTEFGKYADILDKVNRKILEASSSIEDTAVRARAIERKLKSVEAVPDTEAAKVLSLAEEVD